MCAFGCEGIGDLAGVVSPLILPFPSPENRFDLPQRLHNVCVLLWRLPKLDVPFAVKLSVSLIRSRSIRGVGS